MLSCTTAPVQGVLRGTKQWTYLLRQAGDCCCRKLRPNSPPMLWLTRLTRTPPALDTVQYSAAQYSIVQCPVSHLSYISSTITFSLWKYASWEWGANLKS